MSPFGEPSREAISIAIVSEVAATKDADPTALDPLYDTVDPDAVDALLERGFSGSVEFEYADCAVKVQGDGTIDVEASQHDAMDRPPNASTGTEL